MPTNTLLQVISAAVTPVVLISAAAVLLLGVNQRQSSLAERIRALTEEQRYSSPSPRRRQNIQEQIDILHRRFRYATRALRWLYLAVVSFAVMVLVMGLASRTGAYGAVVLALFLLGMALILAAIIVELLDLRSADQSISAEVDSEDGSTPR